MQPSHCLLALICFGSACSQVAALGSSSSPIMELVTMIQKIKAKMEAEGKWEQKSYDKYACWCERTMDEKAKEIAAAKLRIKALIKIIIKLSMEIGICTADIAKHGRDKLDIKADIDTMVETRAKKHDEYLADKSEAEQYMGALEAAINVLSKATKADKGGIIETLQEAQVLSVAAGLKGALSRATQMRGIPETDLEMVTRFVSSPQGFFSKTETGTFLQQDSSNPFGDYAPKSGQIQGILKEMYDEYARDLERGAGEEALDKKNFLALKATKDEELKLKTKAHEIALGDCAEKEKQRSDGKLELASLKKNVKALLKFFEETKSSCKEKATMWSNRCRIRTQEILGINKALEILDSPETRKTLQAAATTLLQVSSRSISRSVSRSLRRTADPFQDLDKADAYSRLRYLVSKYRSLGLAQIAAQAEMGGHFDKVIAMVDKMVALLRKEGMDDIEARDRCQTGTTKNKNDKEDTAAAIKKAKEQKEILEDKATKLTQEINAVESEIVDTKKAMEDRLDLRNEEEKEFKTSLKADADAVKILSAAIGAMSEFYTGAGKKSSKEFGELLQTALNEPEDEETPEYTIDKDKAPDVAFGGEYDAKDRESGGIVSIMEMLREDLELEMKDSRDEDAENQETYEKDYEAMSDTLESQEAEKVALEKELADTKERISDAESLIDAKQRDAQDLKEMGESLEKQCAWIATDFESRKKAREAEIEGLLEAKNILAGAE